MNNALSRFTGRFFFTALSFVIVSSASARTLIFQADDARENNNAEVKTADGLTPNTAVGPSPNIVQSSVQPLVAASTANLGGGKGNAALLEMIEQLQEEVQGLRGLVEEQSHQIKVLKKNSKNRYLELDGRVVELQKAVRSPVNIAKGADVGTVTQEQAGFKPGVDASLGLESSEIAPIAISAPPESGSAISGVSDARVSSGKQKVVSYSPRKALASAEEKQAYEQAYALVKAKQFEKAISAFYDFIDKYPEGDLAGNAYYWLGEIYLVLPKLAQAEQAFSIVVQAYEGHAKVPDALYKLGVTLDRMQKPAKSEQYLLDVQKLYPKSTAAKLAKNYKINR